MHHRQPSPAWQTNKYHLDAAKNPASDPDPYSDPVCQQSHVSACRRVHMSCPLTHTLTCIAGVAAETAQDTHAEHKLTRAAPFSNLLR